MESPLGAEDPALLDEALRELIQVNNLENVLTLKAASGVDGSSISPREIPATPLLLLASKERTLPQQDEQEMDDDDIRTHRYWQKWGKRTAQELVKLIEREKIHTKRQRRRELTYSARTRDPRYYLKDGDSESECTEISLLTCSSLAKTKETPTAKKQRRRRGSKVKDDGKEEGQSSHSKWNAIPKRHRAGLIDKLMAKDASHLSAMLGGNIRDKREEEYNMTFTPEERQLLWKTGFTRGLHGKQKSGSTANITTVVPKPNKKKSLTSTTQLPGGSAPSRGSASRPQSPRYLAVQVKNIRRPDSIMGIDGRTHLEVKHPHTRSARTELGSASQVKSVFGTRHSAHEDADTMVVKKYQQGLHGLPDFEGTFTKTVRQKIKQTISAVVRKTGYGDDLDTITEVKREKGLYTPADYARIAKYPQRVLITPELSKVIKVDIRKRMGRPRFHEIRKMDIEYFDRHNPPLDRSNRNLIIFNWLLSNDEDNYDINIEPEICDLEGEEQENTYGQVLFHNDIMNRAATALSHMSNALEDCSTLKTRTNSDFTGDVSGIEDTDDNLSSASFSDFSVDQD